jgi:hypothetical protein
LLDNNCDIHGDAIHGACEGGYKDIVEILIKHNVERIKEYVHKCHIDLYYYYTSVSY